MLWDSFSQYPYGGDKPRKRFEVSKLELNRRWQESLWPSAEWQSKLEYPFACWANRQWSCALTGMDLFKKKEKEIQDLNNNWGFLLWCVHTQSKMDLQVLKGPSVWPHLPFECSTSLKGLRYLFVHHMFLEALMLYRPVCIFTSLMILWKH